MFYGNPRMGLRSLLAYSQEVFMRFKNTVTRWLPTFVFCRQKLVPTLLYVVIMGVCSAHFSCSPSAYSGTSRCGHRPSRRALTLRHQACSDFSTDTLVHHLIFFSSLPASEIKYPHACLASSANTVSGSSR